jgi:hypothetical protein
MLLFGPRTASGARERRRGQSPQIFVTRVLLRNPGDVNAPWAEGHGPLGSPMKSAGSTIRVEQACAIPVNLSDPPALQTPEQTRSPKVFTGICEPTAEQAISIPAKFGRTPRPWPNNKLLTVVYEEAPPTDGNASRPRPFDRPGKVSPLATQRPGKGIGDNTVGSVIRVRR